MEESKIYKIRFTIDVGEVDKEIYLKGTDRAAFHEKKLKDAAKLLGLDTDIEIETSEVNLEGGDE